MLMGMPRSAVQRALFATIGVEMPVADAEALRARSDAAGVPVGAILRGDLEARDAELSAATARVERAARKAASGELARLRREHGTELGALRRQLAVERKAVPETVRLAVERALAEADTPAGRAAAHRQAAVHAELERLEVAEVAEQEARTRARQLRVEADAAEAQERLAQLRGDHDAELEAAERRGEDRMAGVAAERITAAQGAAGRLQPEVERLGSALAEAQERLADLEAVVAGVDAEALAERARRDPSDWLVGLAAATAIMAARPRLAAVAARAG